MIGGPCWGAVLEYGDFSLSLPASFEVEDGPPVLVGQWSGGRHAASGGGWAIRSLEAGPYLDVRRRVAGRVDVNAALSADRFAMLAMREVRETEGLRTLFVGPADGIDSQVGRWIFTAPGPQAQRWVWWHVYWRTPTSFVEFAAWAPLEQFPRLEEDLQRVESAGRSTVKPTETLLFESGEKGCGPPARVDRSAAIRQSRRFDDAREILRQGHEGARANPSPTVSPAAGLRLAEHRAMGVLYRHTETCVHEVARARRVCTVLEGEVKGATSRGLQDALVSCLDADAKLTEDLGQSLEAVWSSP